MSKNTPWERLSEVRRHIRQAAQHVHDLQSRREQSGKGEPEWDIYLELYDELDSAERKTATVCREVGKRAVAAGEKEAGRKGGEG